MSQPSQTIQDCSQVHIVQNNGTNIIIEGEYREPSAHEESIANLSRLSQPDFLQFMSSYSPIEEAFPLNTLRHSPSAKAKQYRHSIYYGEVVKGKKQGLGIMVYTNGRTYEGEWAQDCRKGQGSETFPNGCVFHGTYSNGKPEGTGSYTWPSGQYYDGEWLNGFKHGSGMWRGANGDQFKGEWRFGKPDGYGVHTCNNGDRYEGEFRDSLKHGDGIQKFANGDIYKGHYVNGKPSGYGEYYWLNGSFFKGNFVNGLRDGRGIWKRGPGNCDRYDGNYMNDKKWGEGVFVWASGNIYNGNYSADQRNGYGQMRWVNGSYYKGQWANGVQHGEGQIYVPEEGLKKGLFQHNVMVFVESQDVVQESKKTSFRSKQSKSFIKAMSKLKTPTAKSESDNHILVISNKQGRYAEAGKGRPNQEEGRRLTEVLKPRVSQSSSRRVRYMSGNMQREKVDASINLDRRGHFLQERLEDKCKDKAKEKPQDKDEREKEKKMKSRERVLHSSFYLYRLQHNLKKPERQMNEQAEEASHFRQEA